MFPGHRLKGCDVFKAGIATHYVPSSKLPELQTLLTRCNNPGEVQSVLNKFHNPEGEFSLNEQLKKITYCFAASTIEEILERLEKDGSSWAEESIKVTNNSKL